MIYKDAMDNPIQVGNYIAYGAALGRCSTIHFGLVTELSQRKETDFYTKEKGPTIKVVAVQRYFEKWERIKRLVTLGFFDRLIVLPETHISDEVMRLLHE